ncbi:hypothetical protein BU17DRAFT_60433 [Hysterangium stoloniferum]|nr:hypothetical protein BU17DRAFT_60428 [Hysterangium stoloniferum]KAF8529655.1 hypothetical protein BU17DRAFT_60433 [Hysterangium stoloniferum]
MDGLETPWTNTPPSKFNWDMIAGYEGTVYTPLTQSKEETTAVGTLHLLDNDAKHGHLQSTLQSTPHDSHHSARVQLSAHSDSSSPRLTPSPSPRANPSPLLYDASISSTGASGKGPGTYSARGSSIISPQLLTAVNTRSAAARPDFRRIESGGKASLLLEGPPDTHLASDERGNGEHDDEDEHGDSNAHSGSSTRKLSPKPGMGSGLGLSNMGPVAVGERTVINVRRRVTEQDVMWTDLVRDALKETVADFAEMLHEPAADVRKYAHYELVRETKASQLSDPLALNLWVSYKVRDHGGN